MALEAIQGIYPRCLSIPHEGGACAILIALSGVAVAPIPEIEEWSGLNGSRRRNDVFPCGNHLEGRLPFRPFHS